MTAAADRADSTPRTRDRSRRYDVVLWGATGYTGKLVAQYLARHSSASELRWALAGRSQVKLEAVRDELRGIDAKLGELPLLIADSHDGPSLDALARDAAVVCTTVGPYARHGSELVAACVRHGTDYCDITGEVHWVREMIDRHHEAACGSGARIVHCCGYDSIPSDLGCFMVQQHAREAYGAPCRRVTTYVGKTKGGFSGGTMASMLGMLERMRTDEQLRRLLADPYGLNPDGERQGPDGPDSMGISLDREAGTWTGPFIMAAINGRVVRRTNALLDYPYGRDFRYREVMGVGGGLGGLRRAVVAVAGIAGFGVLLSFGPTRRLMERRVLPAPGEGPTREQREAGFFRMKVVGRDAGAGGAEAIDGRVAGDSDPGYGETAKMLGESALCLALDGGELECGGGVLTPAACMGERLLERLRRAGMTFEVG